MLSDYSTVIFDLDGTLLDTSPGIFASVRHAERSLGLPPVTDEQLNLFVGPPPTKMYQDMYKLSYDEALLATRLHREYGLKFGVHQAQHYPDMLDVLRKLKQNHFNLAVATLKMQHLAELILKEFGLINFFDIVVGMDSNESRTKTDTIQMVLDILSIQPSDAIMIGDSIYDYVGATDAGVTFVAALYGFGFKDKTDLKFESIKKPYDILFL